MSIHKLQAHRAAPLLLAAAVVLLAGCGAAPQAPGGQGAPTTAADAPTAYPAPLGDPTAYPAPGENTVPTAYPAPLGEAAQPTGETAVTAPTRPPMEATSGAESPSAIAPVPVPTLPSGLATGEVPPDKVAQAVADLVQRTGADPATVIVVSAQAVEWPDGSLGCPRPGMVYLQVITPGYKLVLETGGQQYNYHAAVDGDFFLCEGRQP